MSTPTTTINHTHLLCFMAGKNKTYFVALSTKSNTSNLNNGMYRYLDSSDVYIDNLVIIDAFNREIPREVALNDKTATLVAWHAEFVFYAIQRNHPYHSSKLSQWRSIDVWRAASGLSQLIDRSPDERKLLNTTSKDGTKLPLGDADEIKKRRLALVAKDAQVTKATWHVMTANHQATMPNWSEWHTHVVINSRGVTVDKDFVYNYCKALEFLRDDSRGILAHINKGKTPTAIELRNLINSFGYVRIKDLTRTEIAKVQSVKLDIPDVTTKADDDWTKKTTFRALQAALLYKDLSDDNKDVRLHSYFYRFDYSAYCGAYRFYGTTTGRWTSPGVNLHNLSKDGTLDELHQGRKFCAAGDIQSLVNASIDKGRLWLLRTAFRAEEGCKLVMMDYRQIEARLLAAFVGEEWKINAYKAGLDLYKVSASKMFSVSYDNVTDSQRAYGKLAEISLGYGAGVQALTAKGVNHSVATRIVDEWRSINAKVVEFWTRIHKAYTYTYAEGLPSTVNGLMLSKVENGVMIQLLTGRAIVCVDAPSAINGATLTARVISAMARDIMAHSLVELERQKLQVVMHNQDEIVCEIKDDNALDKKVQKIRGIMLSSGNVVSSLLLPLPLDVDVKVNDFYY